MINVLHAQRSRCRSRFGGLAAALAIGASACPAAALAGNAGSSFRISINLLPETVGSCSAISAGGAPQVTCRPNVVGVTSQTDTSAARDPTIVRYRTDQGFRLAGEMTEIGNENYFAWVDGDRTAWGQYSSRLVVAGGREYVEMTVSW
jgi:hypothetical protein